MTNKDRGREGEGSRKKRKRATNKEGKVVRGRETNQPKEQECE
jgi:hypothetical protein